MESGRDASSSSNPRKGEIGVGVQQKRRERGKKGGREGERLELQCRLRLMFK